MAATSIYLAETGIVHCGKSQDRSLKIRDKLHAPPKDCRLLTIIVLHLTHGRTILWEWATARAVVVAVYYQVLYKTGNARQRGSINA